MRRLDMGVSSGDVRRGVGVQCVRHEWPTFLLPGPGCCRQGGRRLGTVCRVAGSDPLIEARDLRKSFDGYDAVRGIDFTVERGEIFGFLGPNGAGKSTTMRMIGCTSPATGGTLRVMGLDTASDGRQIRARLGVVPQEDSLDTELSVLDNLRVYGRYYGLSRTHIAERADELLAFAQLGDRADSTVFPLSGGMKRRLTIARSLIHEPELLLLDEPTTGLDPQARHVLWDRLYSLKRQGVTQVITTHYMDEAEQLCDRLVVMDEGVIVAHGSPAELIARHVTRDVVEVRYGSPEAQADAEPALRERGWRIEPLAERVLVYADDGDACSATMAAEGLGGESRLVRRSTLEDVFLHLTGRTLED